MATNQDIESLSYEEQNTLYQSLSSSRDMASELATVSEHKSEWTKVAQDCDTLLKKLLPDFNPPND